MSITQIGQIGVVSRFRLALRKGKEMKALRWHGKEDLRYEDVPKPSPEPGDVKVKVRWVGICGSDLHEYQDGPVFVSAETNPRTGKSIPIILGHEFAGDVIEVGKEVTDYKPGDRVTADCIWSCGTCYYCKRSMDYLCPKVAYLGFHADGAFAEYFVAPAYSFYKLPDSISYEVGALTEPLAVGLHAVRRSKLQVGDTVAIVGAGTIGISTLLGAKAAGITRTYVLELSKKRSDMALTMGASGVINPKEVDPVKAICELTNGLGADIAFDCVGNPTSGPLAVDLIRKGGTAIIIGMSPKPSPDFNFLNIVLGEKTVLGSIAYHRETATVIDLISAGIMDPSGLITAKVSFADAVDKAFRELIYNPDSHLKILLHP
jgi:(R,R)-butanediol dehydrogenase/meso-butanediol dehydrogenase/diacetyl reductase